MIIETKLLVPVTKGVLISRQYLLKKLDQGLSCRLTVLEAATGYGKSTLLGEWAATLCHPVAWVSLDDHDNQHQSFWLHIIASLQHALPDMDRQFADRHLTDDSTGVTLVMNLLNFLNKLDDKMVLIWDDFHVLRQQSLLDLVDYFLRRLPDHVHVYIAGKSHPPFMLSRFRVKGQLNELSSDDLTLQTDEIRSFLEKSIAARLDERLLKSIAKQTEGWVVGVSMIAVLLQRYDRQGEVMNDRLLEAITDGHQQIAQYFLDEVLSKHSEDMQHILLQTAILERMNAPLLEAVTETTNGLAVLKYLEQEHLFLVSLDHENRWFRYHHLFQQFLQMELNLRHPEWKSMLHFRAATYLDEHGHMEEALHHYLAAEAPEQAIRLLQQFIPKLLHYERASLYKWLNELPDDLLLLYPELYLQNAASLFLSGFIEEATYKYWIAVEALQKGDPVLSQADKKYLEGGLDLLVAFRSFLERDFNSFQIYTEKYISNDPRGEMLVNFGLDWQGYHQIWDVYMSDGSSRQAAGLLPPLLEQWSKTVNRLFYAHLCIDYAALLYEQNHLQQATKQIEKALQIAKEQENKGLMVNGVCVQVKIWQANHQHVRARLELEEIFDTLQQEAYKRLLDRIEFSLREVQLREGKLAQLSEWVEKRKFRIDDEISLKMFDDYFLFVRFLLCKGQDEEALVLLNRLIVLAKRERRSKGVCRFLLLKSHILLHQNQDFESFITLEEALSIADKGGFIRTVLDLEVEQLLHTYITLVQKHFYPYMSKASFTYAKKLYALALQEQGRQTNQIGIGKEVLLTEREGMVLAYMEEGLTNKDIAAAMYVSLSTVKTHINNLYRKLNVSNRVLAIQRARELGVLN